MNDTLERDEQIKEELRALLKEARRKSLEELRDRLLDVAIRLDEISIRHKEMAQNVYHIPKIPDGYVRHRWIG